MSSQQAAPQIPRHIHQCWFSNEPSAEMRAVMQANVDANPGVTHRLHNLEEARSFLQSSYGADTVKAFDNVKSWAFKADLWRYAILWEHGGIYLDVKLRMLKSFEHLIELSGDKSIVLVRDRPQTTLWNALMMCVPRHPIVGRALANSIHNLRMRRYGHMPLAITGPYVLGEAFNDFWRFAPPDGSANVGSKPGEVPLLFSGEHVLDARNEAVALVYGYAEYRGRDAPDTDQENYYGYMWHRRTLYVAE